MFVSLKDAKGFEPAMLSEFTVFITRFSDFGGEASLSTIRCTSVTVNHSNTTAEGIFGFGTKQYFPDFTDIDSVTLSFVEDVNYTITKSLYAWKKRVVSSKGVYGMPSDYKRGITVTPVQPNTQPFHKPKFTDNGTTHHVTVTDGMRSVTKDVLPPSSQHHDTAIPSSSPMVSAKPKFELTGCFPTNTSPYTYTSNGDILIVEQEFSVDNGDLIFQ